jgi:predicted ATP-grasp superfamily ATP-dependent carboligase
MEPNRHPRTGDGPILVLDPVLGHSVAAVRGLGRVGWNVVVAGAERRAEAPASWSKYVTEPYTRLPDPHGDAAPFGAALSELVRRRRCQAIVAIADGTIARLRQLDIGVPTVPRMDAGLDRVIDKMSLASVCSEAGVLYPPTWTPDLIDAGAGWPRIVKPRQTAIVRHGHVAERSGAFVVHNQDEQDAAVSRLRAERLEPIVQRRVERAGKVNVSIVRSDGRTSFRIAYRVLLEYPPPGGQAASIVSIDPARGVGARALAAAERVCDAAGYRGLANVEYYLQDDGSLCLLEVNARVWGSVWFPERLGLRPAERAVLDVLGENPQPPLSYQVGRRFHRPELVARWLVAPGSGRGPARQALKFVRPWDVFNLVSVTDPLPFASGIRRMAGMQRR